MCTTGSNDGATGQQMSKWLTWVLLCVAVAAGQPAPEPRLVVQTGHTSPITCLAWSPDGRLCLSAADDEAAVLLWHVATGRTISRLGPVAHGIEATLFTPDGQHAIIAGGDGTAGLWTLSPAREVSRFSNGANITSLDLSADGRLLLTGGADGRARLWDLASTRLVRSLTPLQPQPATAAAVRNAGTTARFSPDGRRLVVGVWLVSGTTTSAVYDLVREAPVALLPDVHALRFWPDSASLLCGAHDRYAIYSADDGRLVRVLPWPTDLGSVLSLSPDGQLLAIDEDGSNNVHLYSTADGLRRGSLTVPMGLKGRVGAARFSIDGRRLLAGTYDRIVRIWDLATGTEVGRLTGPNDEVASMASDAAGHCLLTGHGRSPAALWDLHNGRLVRMLGSDSAINSEAVALDPTGTLALTGGWLGARLWDCASGRQRWYYETNCNGIYNLTMSPGAERVLLYTRQPFDTVFIRGLTGQVESTHSCDQSRSSAQLSPAGDTYAAHFNPRVWLWDVQSRRLLWTTEVGATVAGTVYSQNSRFVAVSTVSPTSLLVYRVADGQMVGRCPVSVASQVLRISEDAQKAITLGYDGTVTEWDTLAGRALRQHRLRALAMGRPNAACLLPNGRHLCVGETASGTSIWDLTDDSHICSLYSFTDGTWAVVAPDGRFDTNNLEEIRGLHWVLPNDPLTPLPLESFMRDYYEPRLLSRLLAGERMAAVRPLTDLNTAQPEVRLAAAAPGADNTATVNVTVAGAPDRARTGRCAEDLRLFRDGQLVGHVEGRLPLDAQGTYHGTFSVRVPRRAGLKSLQLSAYCFNDDRVKSATARATYVPPQPPAPVTGRALVLAVGVDTYADATLMPLQYAAADAVAMRDSLVDGLARTRAWSRVDSVLLTSTAERQTATRDNVRLVLDRLAGRPVDATRLAAITGGVEVPPARPEDLVVITWSGHGSRDHGGTFYLVPSDAGAAATQPISSSDLSRWLQDVDAGEIVFVVDACHAEAAVASQGFKPGPLGSRGLGQLAYDKGLTLLAASRADRQAKEYGQLRHSLLTYVLVREGLGQGRAAVAGRLTLGGWLDYGCTRTPRFEAELRDRRTAQARNSDPLYAVAPQQPVLFRFRKSPTDVMLETGSPSK